MSDNSEIYLIEDLNHQIDGFKERIADLEQKLEEAQKQNNAIAREVLIELARHEDFLNEITDAGDPMLNLSDWIEESYIQEHYPEDK